jgi:succinoglycan biosynthesis protein ExoL
MSSVQSSSHEKVSIILGAAILMKYNYFFYTGNPGPGMLDLVRTSISSGKKTKLFYIDRLQNDIIPDFSDLEENIKCYRSKFNEINFKRIAQFPIIANLLYQDLKKINEPISINVHTFDTLIIAMFVGLLLHGKNITFIYQVRDLHRLQISKHLSGYLVRFFENILIRKCSKLLVSSPGFYHFYRKTYKYKGECVLVENIPRKAIFQHFGKHKIRGKENLKVGYVGIVRYLDSLKYLVSSLDTFNLKSLKKIDLFVAGGGDKSVFEAIMTGSTNYESEGQFEYKKDICRLYSKIDIIYAVYDSNDYNCSVAMPNKFYESLVTGKPIIVAKGTYLSKKVEKLGVGISVDINSPDLIEAFDQIENKNSWYNIAKLHLRKYNINKLHEEYNKQLINAI